MNNWYTMTKANAAQGQVADEVTGKTIAVTYDAKHAPLVAAAPALLEALEGIMQGIEDACECLDEAPRGHCFYCMARAAIARATGTSA